MVAVRLDALARLFLSDARSEPHPAQLSPHINIHPNENTQTSDIEDLSPKGHMCRFRGFHNTFDVGVRTVAELLQHAIAVVGARRPREP